MNSGERVRLGMAIVEVLADHFGDDAPIKVVDDILEAVEKDAALRTASEGAGLTEDTDLLHDVAWIVARSAPATTDDYAKAKRILARVAARPAQEPAPDEWDATAQAERWAERNASMPAKTDAELLHEIMLQRRHNPQEPAAQGRELKDFVEHMVEIVEEAAGMMPYFAKDRTDADLLEVAKDYWDTMNDDFTQACAEIDEMRIAGKIAPFGNKPTGGTASGEGEKT
jgi:hypothetical protein